MFSPFKLRTTLGRAYNTDFDDTLRTKQALAKLGHYEVPDYGIDEYPDEPLFRGIEAFQKRHGLLRDGIMKPDGETATKLGQILAEKDRRSADADTRSLSLLPPAPDRSTQWLEKSRNDATAPTGRPTHLRKPLQSASLLAKPTQLASDVARPEPNPGKTKENSSNEEEKKVAFAIAPAIPLIGEMNSAITAIFGMLGLSSLLKRDTPEESEKERACREQLEDDTGICDEVWRKHGDSAAAKCRASAMERYANCLAGRPIQPLYKGTD